MKVSAFGFTQHLFPSKKGAGFTLIELLIVIALLSILMGAVIVGVNPAARLGEAGDAVRISDLKMIVGALEQYLIANGRYPARTADGCCDGWDQGPCGSNETFIQGLVTQGFMKNVPTDPTGGSGTGCYGYAYYRYPAGYWGCDSSKGPFYILGVWNMESSGRPHPDSPGVGCGLWELYFDWVTIGFEK